MEKYNHQAIEQKWQQFWADHKTFAVEEISDKPKYYVLDMFPYPSGAGLHVGHPMGYIGTDIVSRKKRHEGYNVLHPMGWDAFGLPTENYAIKTGMSPQEATKKNAARYREQLQKIGLSYDWDREIATTDPKYYKWTQWIFLKMYERGLLYQDERQMYWCPKCKTVCANEEVEQGEHERCGSPVERRAMRQWMFAITKYADRLLADLDTLHEWPESIKAQQRSWIGRSEGLLFTAPVEDNDASKGLTIQTYSTHYEAMHADTFVVIAPDHPLLNTLLEGVENSAEIKEKCEKIVQERMRLGHQEIKEPEGVFTGRYLVDPLGNGRLPIWVANYALADYGTGIVKCSAHDERDFAFAKKYHIALKPVLVPHDDEELKQKVLDQEVCYTDMHHGRLLEPAQFSDKPTGEYREALADYAVEMGYAEKKVQYKLRDWIFSRNRYWGEPIPLVRNEKGDIIPIPESELPLVLPAIDEYHPTDDGQSPLARAYEWKHLDSAEERAMYGEGAERETLTMPNWAGSCWYWLRFMDPHNTESFVDKKTQEYWGPVDLYVGGAEHAVLHLLYARFWHKALYDMGLVSTIEPFKKLVNQGLIIAEDGRKMSKSYGNVVNPDEICDEFGADTFRVYEMFMGPFDQSKQWSTDTLKGTRKFLDRVWRVYERYLQNSPAWANEEMSDEAVRAVHKTIYQVGGDIDNFKFNTAVSALMVLTNTLTNTELVSRWGIEMLTILMSPFAPHLAEEMWQGLGNTDSVSRSPWPQYDPEMLVDERVMYAVQVNGKVRAELQLPADINREDALQEAKNYPNVAKYLDGNEVKKEIFVPQKIIGFVV